MLAWIFRFDTWLALAIAMILLGCAGSQPGTRVAPPALSLIATAKPYDGSIAPGGMNLALMGADPVARFPDGVHDPNLGRLIPGNASRYAIAYRGAIFAFANKHDLKIFESDPVKFVPAIGGYCLRAMSQHHITPGDPHNVYFNPEANGSSTWAVFGRAAGEAAWAALNPYTRRQATAAATAYYRARTGSRGQ